MKSIIGKSAYCLLFLATSMFWVNSFAEKQTVGPAVWVTGTVTNNAFAPDNINYRFTAANQDAIVHFTSVKYQLEIPKNSTIIVTLKRSSPALSECELTFIHNESGYVTIQERTLDAADVDCVVTGDPNLDTSVITINPR